jgi:hypothetical protein
LYSTPQKLKRKNAKFKIADTVRLARKMTCLKKGLLQIGQKSSLLSTKFYIPDHGLKKL